VLWLGDHASGQISEFATTQVRGVALALAGAGRNRKALELARERGLRPAFDPEPWRNQLEPDHPKRAGTFSKLPYALADTTIWDPATPLAPSEVDEVPHAWLESQIAVGGLDLLIPGHVYPGVGGPARRNDLTLARRALELAENQMLAIRPSDDADRTITVQVNVLLANTEPLELERLADAYAELGAERYWINAVNFTGSIKQFALLRGLTGRLKQKTGAEITLAGLGRLWPGALIEGADCVCFGYQRSAFPFPPANLAEELDEDDGLGVHVYHPAVMGAIRLGDEGEWTRQFLFQRFPCRCGHHEPQEPPDRKPAQILHNAWCAARELEWATSPTLSQAAVDTRIAEALALRVRVGMGKLDTAWTRLHVREDAPGQAEDGGAS
jgi:hypothetical protein